MSVSSSRRGAAFARAASRWLLPTAGAAAFVLAAAMPAHAATIDVIATTPAGATTTSALTWDVASTDPAATSCQLELDTGSGPSPVGTLVDCPFTGSVADPQQVSYTVTDPGVYTLTAYDAAAVDVVVGTTPEATSGPTAVAPVAPSLTGPAGPSNDRSPAWTAGAVVSGATLGCTASGPVLGSVPATCSTDATSGVTSVALDLSAATSDDTVTVALTQTANGQTSAAGTATYALDVTPPATLTPAPSPATSTSRTPSIPLVVSGGTLAGTDAVTCAVSGPDPAASVSSCTSSAVALDLAAAADGVYTVTVTVTDVAGNTSHGLATYTLLPPTPTVVLATSRGNGDTVGVTITEPGTVTLSCTVTGPAGSAATLGPCQPGSNTLDVTGAPDGTYAITVTATDSLGLTSSATKTYVVDRTVTAPTVGLPTATAVSGSGHSVAVAVTEPDTDGVTLTCSVAGPSAATLSGCGSSMTLDLPAGAADGTYVVTVTATDDLGNTATATAAYTLIPPAPTTPAPAKTASATTVTWTMSDAVAGVSYACSVSGAPSGSAATCSVTGSVVTLNVAGGSPDGLYSVVVRAFDGTSLGDPTTLTYTLVPPAPTTPAPTASGSGTSPAWALTDAVPGVTYQCSTPTGPATVTATCGSTVTLHLTGAPDGTYSVTVVAVDGLGHAGDPVVLSYTLVPPAPVSSPAASRSGAGLTPTWTLTDAVPGVTYVCTVVSGPAAFTPSCGSTVSLSLGGLPDGVYSFTVVAVDALRHAGDPLAMSYTLLPPAPTVVASPTSPASDRAPEWTVIDAVAGVTYTCSVAPASAASATCTGGDVVLTLGPGAADGTYTVTVAAIDGLGNTGPATTLTYTLVPPAPTVVTAPPALSASGHKPKWTVTDAVAGVTYTCSVAAPASFATVTCTAAGAVTLTLSASALPGTYVVTVRAVDSLGGIGDPLSLTYTLIAPSPTTPTPTVVASGLTPSWTVSDTVAGVTYDCTVVSGPVAFTPSCTGSTVSLDLTGDPDGVYVLAVQAVDAMGNAGDPLTLTYTLIPPAPVTGSPSTVGSGLAPTWTVGDSVPGVTYLCTVVSGPVAFTPSCTGSTVSLDLTGDPDGVYVLTVQAVDSLGHAGDALSLTYTLIPPAPTTATPSKTAASLTPNWALADSVPGVTYLCTVVSGPAAFTPSCAGSTASLNLTGLPDGVYVFTVQAVDALHNAGDPLTVTYTLIPPAPRTATPSVVSSSVTPSWAVTDRVAGVTYLCTVVSGPAAFTPSCAGSTVSLDLAGLPDGVYVLTVQAVDALGNAGNPLTLTYTLIPPGPVTGSPSMTGSDLAPSWSIADSVPGVTYVCTVVSGPAAFSPTCGPSAVSLDLAGLPDGVYVLIVRAVDGLGNVGDPLTLTYTLIPPAPTTPDAVQQGAGHKPSWALADSVPGVTYLCTVVSGPAVFTPSCAGSTASLNLTGLPDGVYVLTVQAVDSLGHAGDPLTLTYTLIPPPPHATVVPPSPGNSRTPAWRLADAVPGVTYLCSVIGPSGSTATVACTGSTLQLDLTGSPDGLYTVSVLAVDSLGNTNDPTTPLVLTYLLDTIAPISPAVDVTPSPSQSRTPTFTISAVEAGGVLTCTLQTPAGATVTVPTGCGTTVALDLTGQPDGSYVLSVTVTDAAGNTSVATTAPYVLDTTAPVAPTVIVPAPTSNDTTPTLTIVGEPGATLTCTVDRNLELVATVPCPVDGTFDLSGLADGEFEITVVATDAAGNTSAPTTVTYLLDTTAPDAAIVTTPASPSPIVAPTWFWSAEAGSTTTCTLIGPSGVVAGPIACASPYTASFAGLPDGTYTLTVVVTDAAGNMSRSTTSVFVLDRTAPVPPTVVPPRSPGNSRAPQWLISGPAGTTLTCTLTRGGQVIAGPMLCPANGVFSLAGLPDGTYVLHVTATDRAGNVSAVALSSYVLDTRPPPAPSLDFASASPATSRTASWGFTLPPGTTGRCQLTLGTTIIATRSCTNSVSFTLPATNGTYVVRVYAIDAAGNASAPLLIQYVLAGQGGTGGIVLPPPGAPLPRTGPGSPNEPSVVPISPASVARQLFAHLGGPAPSALRKVAGDLGVTPTIGGLPLINDKLTKDVSSAVQSVVNAVSKAGGGTGFPLLLLIIVAGFLVVQSRIDRRDPKLALASVAADDSLQFRPPPSRGADR